MKMYRSPNGITSTLCVTLTAESGQSNLIPNLPIPRQPLASFIPIGFRRTFAGPPGSRRSKVMNSVKYAYRGLRFRDWIQEFGPAEFGLA